jgi:hypothetical protein
MFCTVSRQLSPLQAVSPTPVYRQEAMPRVVCTTHTYLSQFKRSSGHPHRCITTQTIRNCARPCADTCSAHHGLETSVAGTARAARHARAWQGWRGLAHPLVARRPQTPARPQRSVVRLVFYWLGCVPQIGTLWKASHGRGGVGGGQRSGAAPLACVCSLRVFRLERRRKVMLWSLLRQGPRSALPSAAGSPP